MATIIDGNLKTGLVIRKMNHVRTNLHPFIRHATPTGGMKEMDTLTLLLHLDLFNLGWKLASPALLACELNDSANIKLHSAKCVQSRGQSR